MDALPEVPPALTMPNWLGPTLGGRQFWLDLEERGACRLQQNRITGLCRILDGDDRRLAWGSLAACREEWRRIRAAAAAGKPRTFVLVHGLARTRGSFRACRKFLEAEGANCLSFGYPSLFLKPEDAAAALGDFIAVSAPEGDLVLIGHSLGGLLGRRLLDSSLSPRILAVISLGAPHEGCPAADQLANTPLSWLGGPAASRLNTLPGAWARGLPRDPRLICCAGVSGDHPWPPYLDRRGDGLVPPDSAAPSWAEQSLRIRASHTFLMDQEESRRLMRAWIPKGS
ncbi:MAG: hypothetical protein RL095_1545 [Verrucomicrobiota bacterium]